MQQRFLAVKIAESTSIWQRVSYHRITLLVEGLGIMEVFQNNPQPLHSTAFVVVTLLALARVLACTPSPHLLMIHSSSRWSR